MARKTNVCVREKKGDLGDVKKELHGLGDKMHALEKYAAVIETRQSVIASSMSKIEHSVDRQNKDLHAHIIRDDKDRIRLLIGILTILVTTVGGGLISYFV